MAGTTKSNANMVKVAAVQAAPVSFDLQRSLDKLEKLTTEAAQAGADLVAFPEGFLSAYPWRYAFDATIGAREPRGMFSTRERELSLVLISLTGRKWFAKYFNSAVAIPSPELDRLCNIAEKNKVLLSVGIIEKDGGTLYCTAILIDKLGKLVSTHRKVRDSPSVKSSFQKLSNTQLIPTACERLVWGRGAGDGLTVVNTDIGKVGGLIW